VEVLKKDMIQLHKELKEFYGSLSELAKRTGKKRQYVARCLKNGSNSNPAREVHRTGKKLLAELKKSAKL